MKTRRDLEVELTALGVSGDALEALLRETGRERHQFRVQAAITAAEEYYLKVSNLDRDEASPEITQTAAAAILWSDVIGIGGRDNCEGGCTLRHPALRECGKGRKQATDGEAWDAAILAACYELEKKSRGWFAIFLAPVLVYEDTTAQIREGDEVVLVYEDTTAQIRVDECYFERRWIHAIAREGLRRAAGLPRWHTRVPFKAPPESAPIWTKLVNQFLANREEIGLKFQSNYQYLQGGRY